MFQKTILICGLLFPGLASFAQTINWATDVAPILYENCASCHRDGGIGHFSLVGYGNAFSNREAIQNATENQRMPPWKPDPTYRQFAHENRLSDAQIQTIKQWVDQGGEPGDLSQAPADPVFAQGSDVGVPDHVLMTPFYTVTATQDEYRCFVIPNGLQQDAFLRGLEAIPGNHEVVHHILIYEDTTGQGKILDDQTQEAGYVNFGGPGVQSARLVGAWVPGSRTFLGPPNMGIKLKAGADLILQMHYPAGVTGMSDQTTLNFFFTPTNQGIREVKLAPILNHSPLSLENYPLNIPAGQVKTYHEKFKVPGTASALSVAPHMHLIGRNITCFAVTPQNDTIPLIRINDWDFHWQGAYYFQKIQKIPAFSTLHAYATYDNTLDNPNQPSDPPQNVVQGESTTDEMMLVYFSYLPYQSGDENIVLDSTILNSAVHNAPENQEIGDLNIYPNPTRDLLYLDYQLDVRSEVQIYITDLNGRMMIDLCEPDVKTPGQYQETIPLNQLPPGVYMASVQTGSGAIQSLQFVKY